MSTASLPIVIRKQVRLGLLRTLEICLRGISFRLFRSLVTVAIVSVAVAFMTFMLAGSHIGQAVQRTVQAEAERHKLFDRWRVWIEQPMGRKALFRLAADLSPDDPKWPALRRWGELEPSEIDAMVATARAALPLVEFYGSLPPGKQFVLAQGTDRDDLLDWLVEPAHLAHFLDQAPRITGRPLPGGAERLIGVVEAYRHQVSAWDRVVQGRQSAQVALLARTGHPSVADLLAESPPDLAGVLRDLGFCDPCHELVELRQAAVEERKIRRLAECLRHPGFRRELSVKARVNITQVNLALLAQLYLSRGGTEWFAQTAARHGLSLPLAPSETQRLLENYLQRTHTLDLEARTLASTQGRREFSPRTAWLLGIAFVVCVVGIANAMLMSVMERFREIATMKCLGATDGFVMTLFVLESCMQGLVGGIAGTLLGVALAVPVSAAQMGALVWRALPYVALLRTGGLAVVVGVVLAAIASVYPAWVAARLAPMEAMRVE